MTVIKTDCALLSCMLEMCIPPGIAHEIFVNTETKDFREVTETEIFPF